VLSKGLNRMRMGIVMIDQNTGNCCINQHAEIIRKIQDTAVNVCMCVCVGAPAIDARTPQSYFNCLQFESGSPLSSYNHIHIPGFVVDSHRKGEEQLLHVPKLYA